MEGRRGGMYIGECDGLILTLIGWMVGLGLGFGGVVTDLYNYHFPIQYNSKFPMLHSYISLQTIYIITIYNCGLATKSTPCILASITLKVSYNLAQCSALLKQSVLNPSKGHQSGLSILTQ